MGCGCGKSNGARRKKNGSLKSANRNRTNILSSSKLNPINNSSRNRKRRDIERKRREQILKKFGKL